MTGKDVFNIVHFKIFGRFGLIALWWFFNHLSSTTRNTKDNPNTQMFFAKRHGKDQCKSIMIIMRE